MDTPPAEVEIDAAMVARLVEAQHPALAGGCETTKGDGSEEPPPWVV